MRVRSSFPPVWLALLAVGVCCCGPGGESSARAADLDFVAHRLGKFRSESCGVADFNRDGKPDVVAGPFLYLSPDWLPKRIRELEGSVDELGRGYYWDFMNAALDIDGDGWLDVVSCSWHGKRMEWYRNLGESEGLWPRTVVEENGNYEHGELWDVDGDGRALEILPSVAGTVWHELVTTAGGKRELRKHVVSERILDWGCGAGDVNGDGRPDILRPNAWYEAPADCRSGDWREHPWALGDLQPGKADHTPQIFVLDVNADGKPDIVTSSAHKYGIFWYEQTGQAGETSWQQHVIDQSWTQAHSLALADLDGDGDLDLVAGKRFMAHDGGDPGEYEALGVYWYELQPGHSTPWIKHVISFNQGIGSGMNIPIADLDQDGDLDIVVTGKWGGPVWFENKGAAR